MTAPDFPLPSAEHIRSSTVRFQHPFTLRAVAGTLPAGDYLVDTEEELIIGLSFAAYRRSQTMIYLPVGTTAATALQFVWIDPQELADALRRDAQG